MKDDPTDLNLGVRDIVWLIASARREIRRLERIIERSNFVPEPGRIDMNKAKIERIRLIIKRLQTMRDELDAAPYLNEGVSVMYGIGDGRGQQFVALTDAGIAIIDEEFDQRIDLTNPTAVGEQIERMLHVHGETA